MGKKNKKIRNYYQLWVISFLAFIFLVGTYFYSLSISSDDNSSCASCHGKMIGFSGGHTDLSCISCHLGNDLDFSKSAHENMISIPGNLDNVSKTCSQVGCHVGIDHRVQNSLMNTMSGVVAVDKHIFGESMDLNAIHHIESLGSSASDTHLKQLCASCHLGNKKNETGPISELSRGGGCNACHLNYSKKAIVSHNKYVDSEYDDLPNIHPKLSLNVTNNHCFGCHSRSARISTNYEGWHELEKNSKNERGRTRRLEDGRLFEFIKEDVHHKLGLNCIDCHNANEVMGDGIYYAHQENAVKITCTDCHKNDIPKSVLFDELDAESQKIIELRKMDTTVKYVVGKSGPMINVHTNSVNSMIFVNKLSKEEHVLSKPSWQCTQNAHIRLACETCHTSWSPQCVSCHTSFDTSQMRYNHISHLEYKGKWIEKGAIYLSEFPTLGIVSDQEIEKIKTFIQGMTMELDLSDFSVDSPKKKHFRYFAPTFSHTISSKGQTCSNCHKNPVALGYGRGELHLNDVVSFTPSMKIDTNDNLPIDAWIGFLSNEKGNSTRTNTRNLNKVEQIKILRVGKCLSCHEDNSQVSKLMLKDFENALLQKTEQCRDMKLK